MTAQPAGKSSFVSTNEIRRTFLDYFKDAGHEIVPSAPLVPLGDPTLLFTNAGMVPFKNLFTGTETRSYTRATSSQKCVRAGGKHNDLDNVGYTARHHTFFEMLGNFSFGDYFKEDAITHAWSLITKEFGIDKDRLLVTVYHDDDEAFNLWKKIAGFPDEKIIRIATNDNFWSMGDTGPCGPCSEIFYDHGAHIPGGPPGSPDEDGDRFIEIWNLVFMQYEQLAGGERLSLPKPSIDTGMGLERISAVLQGVHDNYDTDTFKNLIKASVEATGAAETDATRASHRVIADHLRAVSFLIADGVLPSNEGRGYVLRRIMRRAMRHGHLLGAKDLVMHKLVPALLTEMGGAYSELGRAKALIQETLRLEEDRFRTMLEKGLRLLGDETSKLQSGQQLPGDVAFKLYDTYGFPLDLTQDALRAEGRSVDTAGFDEAMGEQRRKARAAWSGSGDAATSKVWFELEDKFGATEFLGYTSDAADGEVLALVQEGAEVASFKAGDEGLLITNQTPFYAESGGQAGDSGTMTAKGVRIDVLDTLKMNGKLHAHKVKVLEGSVQPGLGVRQVINTVERDKTRANHSATHLLHEVLRRNLGEHVTQKGSLVTPERLRFDISHPKAVTPEELAAIEAGVNALVRQNTEVETRLLTYDDALDAGAMALFGEKYGDEVRVLFMGAEGAEGADIAPSRTHYSIELCGGTHVKRTGDIGTFVIVSEGAVASGVRRIEALTGHAAFAYLADQRKALSATAAALKVAAPAVEERVIALMQEKKSLEKQLADAKRKAALGGGASGAASETVAGVNFMGQILDGFSPKDLRGLAESAKKTLGSGIVAFVAVNDGKAAFLVSVTDDLTERFNSVELVRVGATIMGGSGGGGRPDMAQAGGPDGNKAQDAIDAVKAAIAAV